jgi:uncharacterized membrane protein YfcA
VTLTTWTILALLFAGLAAGFANTVASSGSAVTLPVLLGLGVDAPIANGTNRLGILIGCLAGVVSFHRAGAIDWRHVLPLSAAAAGGTAIGVGLAEALPEHDIRAAIVGAIFVALLLLCLRPKRWLRDNERSRLAINWKTLSLVALVGVWAGFIVLDCATYFLFTLVLAVGYGLVHANAMKVVLLVATTPIALVVFISHDQVLWGPGLVLAAASMIGAVVAVRVALMPSAATWIFRLLVVVIGAEAGQLALQHVYKL